MELRRPMAALKTAFLPNPCKVSSRALSVTHILSYNEATIPAAMLTLFLEASIRISGLISWPA